MNNPDNPGFTSTTALVDRTTQGPVPVLVPVPHFILESTIHVSIFMSQWIHTAEHESMHPAGWSLSPPAIPARQANASLTRATITLRRYASHWPPGLRRWLAPPSAAPCKWSLHRDTVPSC